MEGNMGGILSEHSSQMSRVFAPLGCQRFFPLDSMKRVLYTKTTSEGMFLPPRYLDCLPSSTLRFCVCVRMRFGKKFQLHNDLSSHNITNQNSLPSNRMSYTNEGGI